MESTKQFVGVSEIMKMFGIGRNKALALLNTEGFPAIKLGRTYRVDVDELNRWIENSSGKSLNLLTAEKEK